MTPRLIDTHCHIHFPAFDADRDAVLQRMATERIYAITVGSSATTSASGIAFAETHEGIWSTVGFHPEHFTSSYHDESEGDIGTYSIEALGELAQSSKKVVAIGETGLDFFRIDESRNRAEAIAQQERGFREHITLAHELNLPLVIHCRDAFTRVAEILEEEQRNGKRIRAVIHCFTGTWADATALLARGCHLSFTGIVTYPVKKTQDPETHVHRVIERMPLDRLLVETDAPWLAPVPYRGKQNEPAHVAIVAQKVAELRGVSVDDIAASTTAAATALFF